MARKSSRKGLKKTTMDLSKSQIQKILTGKPVIVDKKRIIEGIVPLMLKDGNFKKMEEAMMKGKGMKLTMDEDEIMGSGLKEFFEKLGRKVKSGAKKAAQVYREDLRDELTPVLRKGIQKGVDLATDVLQKSTGVDLNQFDTNLSKAVENLAERGGVLTRGKGFSLGGGYIGEYDRVMTELPYVPVVPLLPAFYSAPVYAGYGITGSNVNPFVQTRLQDKVKLPKRGKGFSITRK